MSGDIETQSAKKRRVLRWTDRSTVCVAAALSSVLTLLAFPPFGLWWLVFVVPWPLLWACSRVTSRRLGAAVAAAVGTAPMWAWQQQWMFGVSALGALLLVVYLSLYTGGFLWIAVRTRDRLRVPVWLIGPVLWAGLEWLRGTVLFDGYPWLMAGHPVIESPGLARAGSVVGASGVSLLTLLVGGGVYGVVCSRGRWRAVAAGQVLVVTGLWAGLSVFGPRVAVDGVLRVAVVQTNVPQDNKQGWSPPQRMFDLDRMLALTELACSVEPRPELVVWPETMFPGAALDASSINEERAAGLIWYTGLDVAWPVTRWVVTRGADGLDEPMRLDGPMQQRDMLYVPTTVAADSLLAWQERLGVPFLIGAEGYDGLRIDVSPETGAVSSSWEASYNSTYLLRGGRMEGERYDKMHLTPFGEVMPYISAWPWLEDMLLRLGVGASGMSFSMSPGDRVVRHNVETESGLVRVATPVCFEGIVPGVCRRLAYTGGERQADVLVQMTNEGWFGDFAAGRWQHLQIVRWRAVELGTPVVRAANTGVSAVVDPFGAVVATGVTGGSRDAALLADGVLWSDVPLANGGTIYAMVGDLAGWGALAVSGLIVLFSVFFGGRGGSERPIAEESGKPEGVSAT